MNAGMTQLDLFAPPQRVAPVGPFICPWCGTEEPNDALLDQNHWVRQREPGEYDWPAAHSMCIAQSLNRNHVAWIAQGILTGGESGWSCECGKHLRGKKSAFDRDCALSTLRRWADDAAAIGVDLTSIPEYVAVAA